MRLLLWISFVFGFIFSSAYAQSSSPPKENNDTQTKFSSWLDQLTPSNNSLIQERLTEESKGEGSRYLIKTYRPNYILPYYHTGSPDYAAYENNIPDDQTLKHTEFKAQLSLRMPLWEDILGHPYSLQAGYTQLNYWQLYTDSAWFRETNYEPELFIATHPHRNWLVNYGINHQSNGRGGSEERSWNRAYVDIAAAGDHWVMGVRMWTLIFEAQSTDLYNPDIIDYMGHGEILLSYELGKNTFTATARNLETIAHSAFQATWSYPLTGNLSIYAQGFSGYGQSLIEYNHHTNSFGIGLTINDWI